MGDTGGAGSGPGGDSGTGPGRGVTTPTPALGPCVCPYCRALVADVRPPAHYIGGVFTVESGRYGYEPAVEDAVTDGAA